MHPEQIKADIRMKCATQSLRIDTSPKPMNKQQTIAALEKLVSEQKVLAQLYEDMSEEMHELNASDQPSDEPTMGERFNFNVAALTAAIHHINGTSPQ
jgi:hypothetical protein